MKKKPIPGNISKSRSKAAGSLRLQNRNFTVVQVNCPSKKNNTCKPSQVKKNRKIVVRPVIKLPKIINHVDQRCCLDESKKDVCKPVICEELCSEFYLLCKQDFQTLWKGIHLSSIGNLKICNLSNSEMLVKAVTEHPGHIETIEKVAPRQPFFLSARCIREISVAYCNAAEENCLVQFNLNLHIFCSPLSEKAEIHSVEHMPELPETNVS